MTTDRAIDIISTLLKGEWLQSEAAALTTVHGLGYSPRPQTTEESPDGALQLAPRPGVAEVWMSLSVLQGLPVSIGFFIASSPAPANADTRAEYDRLVAAVSRMLGEPAQIMPDQLSPVRWQSGELEVGAQLFDRRDSTVMVWVEHRGRSAQSAHGAAAAEHAH